MPDTAQIVPGHRISETFTADTAEKATAAAVAKYHNYAGVQIGAPVPFRSGGVGGFFARQTYQVLVEVAPTEPSSNASDSVDSVDSVDDVAELLTPSPSATTALVYGRPAQALPVQALSTQPFAALPVSSPAADATADPAVDVPQPVPVPSQPLGSFAAALAGVEKSSTVDAAVTRATKGLPERSAPVVDPKSFGGQLQPMTTTGTPAGPVTPVSDVTGGIKPPPLPIPDGLRDALAGVDQDLLDGDFAFEVTMRGPVAAVADLFTKHYRHPGLPVLDAGDILVVLGVGADAIAGAQDIARQMGAPASAVYAAGGPACAGALPTNRRLKTIANVSALKAKAHKTPLVVAIDTGWSGPDLDCAALMAAMTPAAIWAAVDATRRDADTGRWLATHQRVEGLVVMNAEHTSAPTSVLGHDVPVVFLDGRPASAKQWAGVVAAGVAS